MSNKIKRICTTLNYNERFLTLVFAVTGCISISAIATLVDIPTEITSSTIGLNTSAIIARIKKYKSIIEKKKKRHNELVLLAKTKSNSIECLLSKALINSNISIFRFNLINDVLKNIVL